MIAKAARSFWSRHARIILGLALLVLGIHDLFGAHGFLAMRRTQKQIDQLHSEIDGLNKQNDQLSGQVQSLKTDPQAVERLAREQMGLAKPGEMIFKMPADQQKDDDGKSGVAEGKQFHIAMERGAIPLDVVAAHGNGSW